MIDNYFEKVEKIILDFKSIIKSSVIFKKTYNQKQGYLKGDIVFINSSKLSFIEVKNVEVKEKIKYRYNYMDKSTDMIFRYDNARHHVEITTFPHHKHLNEGITESNEPELFDILFEIQRYINQERRELTRKSNGD